MVNKDDFPDIDMNVDGATIKLHFSDWFNRSDQTQKWLEERIIEDMEPFVPMKTGALRNYIKSVNAPRYGDGYVTVYKKPLPQYPTLLYWGYNAQGKPVSFTCPTAEKMWFTAAKRVHEKEWVAGAKRKMLWGG